MGADREEAGDLGDGESGAVAEAAEAGPEPVHPRAEEQRVGGDDVGDVGAGEAGAG